jgi:hypothetical protein
MKVAEKKRARELRIQGKSLSEIQSEVGCSRSTISLWIKDIELTKEQKARLDSKQARGRAAAADHPNSPKHKWRKIRSDCRSEGYRSMGDRLNQRDLKMIATALYWGEGGKGTQQGVRLSNGDPKVIYTFLRYLREVEEIEESRLKACLHIHPHLDEGAAMNFWSEVTEIPRQRFHKTQKKVSRSSQSKKDNLPMGVLAIIYPDVRLWEKIMGQIDWIKFD